MAIISAVYQRHCTAARLTETQAVAQRLAAICIAPVSCDHACPRASVLPTAGATITPHVVAADLYKVFEEPLPHMAMHAPEPAVPCQPCIPSALIQAATRLGAAWRVVVVAQGCML